MQSYRLVFADDGIGVARRVEFEAEDTADALIFAHREARERTAVLWLGERRLCMIAQPETQAGAAFVAERNWSQRALA